MTQAIDNPILSSPYEQPDRYYEIGPSGPTGEIKDGRRPSESFIPIAVTKKGKGGGQQEAFDFNATGERRQRNDLINEVRRDVAKWRFGGQYQGVTPITRKLLQHWADPTRENRVIFAQREAAETAIFLTEVAGRTGMYPDWRKRLEPENATHNDGLPRIALKMATGSGKTVVMAMLIAWQTLNKQYSPRDSRFTDRFLVVTPGITIRDRLRVLLPEDSENYYDLRGIVPDDMRGGLPRARIVITNYHAFQLKDAKEIRGIAKNTRLLLRGDRTEDVFKETLQAMVSRVLRDLGGDKQQIMVLSDEAHHCYQDKPLPAGEKADSEQQAANDEARVWFKGLQAVAKHVGIKQIYDLSATPFYLKGSGYNEGYIFPWTVSDFSLMDAIESGIVKVPRTPVDDDAMHNLVTYLRLWDFVGDKLPKRAAKGSVDSWLPPPELEGALRSLHRSYEKAFEHWETNLKDHGETPPVFIVVCPNTVVSKLVYDWIAGVEVEKDGEVIAHRPGELELLSNVVDGKPLSRPRTILIDSAQLESGQGIKADFKAAAGAEIAAFKAEYRRRNPGADVEKITDDELLREVMNTVGKRGKLGEQVRCVVSVSMLTEGWDANTVTHILGVRAFRSQLLCEQVVGRGLRRRNYTVNDQGLFEAEYANVYGIPFQFISSDKPVKDPPPPRPVQEVAALEGREDLRITFPKLTGYRVELPDDEIHSLSPHRSLAFAGGIGEETLAETTAAKEADAPNFEQSILDNLAVAGIQNGRKNERIKFSSFETYAGSYIQAIGERVGNGEGDAPGRIGLAIGPQYGTVSPSFVKRAAREALEAGDIDLLAILAFAFDPQVTGVTEDDGVTVEATDEGFANVAGVRKLGRIPVLMVRMNVDLIMGEELKKTGAANLFTVFGEPDIAIRETNDGFVAEIKGIDVYDPTTGEVRSSKGTSDVALWMIDTDYNEESFFVRHCYFTGDNDPYKRLRDRAEGRHRRGCMGVALQDHLASFPQAVDRQDRDKGD